MRDPIAESHFSLNRLSRGRYRAKRWEGPRSAAIAFERAAPRYAGEEDAAFVLRTRRGTPLSQRNAARSIEQAGEEASLGHVTPHVLRRSYGTALSEAGVPVAAAAAYMGHSTEVNHGSYVKAHRDELERERTREALVAFGLGVASEQEQRSAA